MESAQNLDKVWENWYVYMNLGLVEGGTHFYVLPSLY